MDEDSVVAPQQGDVHVESPGCRKRDPTCSSSCKLISIEVLYFMFFFLVRFKFIVFKRHASQCLIFYI